MQLFARILTFIFFAGVVGSGIVILLTFIEDLRDIFGSDPPTVREEDVQVAPEHFAAD